MTYIIDILLEGNKKRTYKIEAGNEDEAKERLKLRLPPDQRDSFRIGSIKIDPNTVQIDEPFGSFGGE